MEQITKIEYLNILYDGETKPVQKFITSIPETKVITKIEYLILDSLNFAENMTAKRLRKYLNEHEDPTISWNEHNCSECGYSYEHISGLFCYREPIDAELVAIYAFEAYMLKTIAQKKEKAEAAKAERIAIGIANAKKLLKMYGETLD